MTQNQINYQRHLEDVRSNTAREAENIRSNRAREEETKRANLANEYLTSSRDAETARANLAREQETNRSNLAREIETNRSNLSNEYLKSQQIRTESADRRYGAELSADASKYAADRGYESRTDSAYINKYGITPNSAKVAAGKVGNTFVNLTTSPTGKKVASAAVKATAPLLIGAVNAANKVKQVVVPVKQNKSKLSIQQRGGSRH